MQRCTDGTHTAKIGRSWRKKYARKSALCYENRNTQLSTRCIDGGKFTSHLLEAVRNTVASDVNVQIELIVQRYIAADWKAALIADASRWNTRNALWNKHRWRTPECARDARIRKCRSIISSLRYEGASGADVRTACSVHRRRLKLYQWRIWGWRQCWARQGSGVPQQSSGRGLGISAWIQQSIGSCHSICTISSATLKI